MMRHGELIVEKIPVNNGEQSYKKRSKFCAKHGKIDLFSIGGELAWQRQHGKCDQEIETGAFIVTQVFPKVMKKAA